MKGFPYIASWTLYWVGDKVSLLVNRHSEFWAAFWYTPYNWCMTKSYDIQMKAGDPPDFPWEPAPEDK